MRTRPLLLFMAEYCGAGRSGAVGGVDSGFITKHYRKIPGHVFYHEVLKIRIKSTREELEGHFGGQSIVIAQGRMLLIDRTADTAYFAKLTAALSQ
jgi:hypothetical protein